MIDFRLTDLASTCVHLLWRDGLLSRPSSPPQIYVAPTTQELPWPTTNLHETNGRIEKWAYTWKESEQNHFRMVSEWFCLISGSNMSWVRGHMIINWTGDGMELGRGSGMNCRARRTNFSPYQLVYRQAMEWSLVPVAGWTVDELISALISWFIDKQWNGAWFQ